MYCGVLPIDESDVAFFTEMDALYGPTAERKAKKARTTSHAYYTRKSRASEPRRLALDEVRAALRKNHKGHRKALRAHEKS